MDLHNMLPTGESWGASVAQIKVAAWIFCTMVTALLPGNWETFLKLTITVSP